MMIGNLKVPGTRGLNIGFGLNVQLVMPMPTRDLSGDTSLTDQADRGIKPKRIQVRFSVRESRTELDYLSRFLNLVEARDVSGNAAQYAVVHPLVQAARIRKMRFCGHLQVNENQHRNQYDVTATLAEVRSVPEKLEAKRKAASAAPTAASVTETYARIEDDIDQ